MPDSTWGMLQKSAVDSETIEQAIVRLIASHEADSSAHLGPGESLEAHKASDVIDHKAGSVLADKNSMSEQYYSTIFESLDGWEKTGDVSQFTWPGVALYIESPVMPESAIYKDVENSPGWTSNTKDMLFQCNLSITTANNYKFLCGMLSTINYDNPRGFGFRYINNVLVGFVGQDIGGTIRYTSQIVLDPIDDVILRVQFNANLDLFSFYVNGVFHSSIVRPGDMQGTVPTLGFWFKTNGTVDGYSFIKQLKIARQV